jgi:predicted CoA-substrate-specific enzyme activase
MSQSRFISLDIGATSVKVAVVDQAGAIIFLQSRKMEGHLRECLRATLDIVREQCQREQCYISALSGSGARHLADLIGVNFVNEVIALYEGVTYLVPLAGSILSAGGIGVQVIRLIKDPANDKRVFKESVYNARCSSGSGIFIDQEVARFNIPLHEFIESALKSSEPPTIAGRCAVFAKTDIIHKHQSGVPLVDIAGAICQMVARNIAAGLATKTAADLPVVFVGGVAQNKAVCRMLQNSLALRDNELIVPADGQFAVAIGAYRHAAKDGLRGGCSLDITLHKIDNIQDSTTVSVSLLKPLSPRAYHHSLRCDNSAELHPEVEYILGIDIGSTSTKIACVSRTGCVLESVSVSTSGRPLDAVQQAFRRLSHCRNGHRPLAVGVTGSGRKFIGDIIGADTTINEITAHAEAAVRFSPEVDTVIDIGGQDSKFIRIKDGQVSSFEMNKVCSAGTGSFLEETAKLLGLDVRADFPTAAFRSQRPLDLGDRCTVFMVSELTRRQNENLPISDAAAGLAYSVINNYLSRVVGNQRIGSHISFQGGVAGNQAVVAALEQLINRKVTVHPHYEIAGALGAALIAAKEVRDVSRFRGFDAAKSLTLQHGTFGCRHCGNNCSVNFLTCNDGRRLFSGDVCGRYDDIESVGRADNSSALGTYRSLVDSHARIPECTITSATIGFPRALHSCDLLPFWTTFLDEIGEKFVVSPPTTRDMLVKGSEISPPSTCLPLKIAYGHSLYLQQTGVRRLFMPSVSSMSFSTREERLNHCCPAAQAWPYTTASLLSSAIEMISPTVRMGMSHTFKTDMISFGHSLGHDAGMSEAAMRRAFEAQMSLHQALRQWGSEQIKKLGDNSVCAVIFSRPYMFSDHQINSRLQPILNEIDVTAIPFDMLAIAPQYSRDLNGMYWYYGKRYLQAARAMKSLKSPAGIFLSLYGCGADSFLIHLLRDALGDIPFLELEVDQHCDFGGIRTRLEAFFGALKRNQRFNAAPPRRQTASPLSLNGRHIYIPQMSEHAFVCSAALHSFGYDAEVMQLTPEPAQRRGKQVVNGGECLPCTLLAGDMLTTLEDHNGQRKPPAFLMVSGDGPCRLGQYTYLLRKVLDEEGYADVPIVDMSQDTSFYKRFDLVSSQFKKRFWIGSVAVDLLTSFYRGLRPLSSDRECLDESFQREVSNLCNNISSTGKLARQLSNSIAALQRFKSTGSGPDVTLAIIGENYVRVNRAANQHLINRLEEMNAVVCQPHLTEWIFYTNWTARLHCLYEKDYALYLKLHLINLVQKMTSYRLHKAVRKRPLKFTEPSVKRIFHLASSHVPSSFEGETIISVGRTVDYYLRGIDGIIHVSPFGCLVGTIYETLSHRISEELGGLPILNLQFDGTRGYPPQEELEAFMIRIRSWKKRSGR